MRAIMLGTALMGSALGLSAPAAAQDAGAEKVNQLIIYGDDVCPVSNADEITVCARKDEGERYRIPEILRDTASPQNEAWANKVLAYETVTRTGTNSCTPVGAGGWTGCAGKLIDAAYAEKRESSDIKFSELIAAERAKRLSTIDADAAATQSRVEVLEKEYEARRIAQENAAATAADAPPPPLPPR